MKFSHEISFGHTEEFHATLLQSRDGFDDVVGVESDMLNAWAAVIVDKLLNLRFLLAIGRLVNCQQHRFLVVGDNNCAQCRIFSVNQRIVHRPEAMELQAASVPISNRFHLQLRLVSVNVIDEVQIDFREIFENRVVAGVMHLIAGKENSFVTAFVDQRVGCVAVLEEIGNLI